jgi:hypothetical protein
VAAGCWSITSKQFPGAAFVGSLISSEYVRRTDQEAPSSCTLQARSPASSIPISSGCPGTGRRGDDRRFYRIVGLVDRRSPATRKLACRISRAPARPCLRRAWPRAIVVPSHRVRHPPLYTTTSKRITTKVIYQRTLIANYPWLTSQKIGSALVIDSPLSRR